MVGDLHKSEIFPLKNNDNIEKNQFALCFKWHAWALDRSWQLEKHKVKYIYII